MSQHTTVADLKLICEQLTRYYNGGSKNTLTAREIGVVLILLEYKLMKVQDGKDKKTRVSGRTWVPVEHHVNVDLSETDCLKIIDLARPVLGVKTLYSQRGQVSEVRRALIQEMQKHGFLAPEGY